MNQEKTQPRTGRARHTVIVSDLHLWQAAPPCGSWMRYRQRDLFPDRELTALTATLERSIAPGDLELVLAGDVLDFDVPAVQGGEVAREVAPADEAGTLRVVGGILDDHAEVWTALARLILRGDRVVLLAGNHDLPLVFEGVRALVRERLVAAAARLAAGPVDVARIARGVVFRAWFHRTDAGVHVEHGSQYDTYCAVAYPMTPALPASGGLPPTMGSLAMRELVAKLGFFNPNVDSTFLLTARGYFQHWVRYYAFTRRSLVLTWLAGSLRIAFGLAVRREADDPARVARDVAAAAAETGCDVATIEAHRALFDRPSLGRVARLLALDRLGLAVGLLLAIAIAVGAKAVAVGVLIAIATTAGAIALRVSSGAHELDAGYDRIERTQREIARLHDARAVVFGHTHVPEGAWDEAGVFFGNSGTWAPTFADVACTEPLRHGSPFVWLRDEGELAGGLYRFVDGRVEPVAARIGSRGLRTPRAAA